MANIIVTITTPKNDSGSYDITSTKATFKVNLDNTDGYNGEVGEYYFSIYFIINDKVWAESRPITCVVDNLDIGSKNSISIKAYAERWNRKYNADGTPAYDSSGFPKYEYAYTTLIDSLTLNIYTHPGAFDKFQASTISNQNNNIIKNVLTASRVNDWVDHFQKVYHWYN